MVRAEAETFLNEYGEEGVLVLMEELRRFPELRKARAKHPKHLGGKERKDLGAVMKRLVSRGYTDVSDLAVWKTVRYLHPAGKKLPPAIAKLSGEGMVNRKAAMKTSYGQKSVDLLISNASQHPNFYKTDLNHIGSPARLPEITQSDWQKIMMAMRRRFPSVDDLAVFIAWKKLRNGSRVKKNALALAFLDDDQMDAEEPPEEPRTPEDPYPTTDHQIPAEVIQAQETLNSLRLVTRSQSRLIRECQPITAASTSAAWPPIQDFQIANQPAEESLHERSDSPLGNTIDDPYRFMVGSPMPCMPSLCRVCCYLSTECICTNPHWGL